MSPLRTGTALRMDLEVCGRTLRLQGVVRTSHPTMGMGIEFTRMAPAEAEKLHRVLSELSGETAAAGKPGVAPKADEVPPLPPASAQEVGEAVLRWFGARETLSRQEFLKLVETQARTAGEPAHV